MSRAPGSGRLQAGPVDTRMPGSRMKMISGSRRVELGGLTSYSPRTTRSSSYTAVFGGQVTVEPALLEPYSM